MDTALKLDDFKSAWQPLDVGTLAPWPWAWRRRDAVLDPTRIRSDGADGIRRGRRLLDELLRFEQE